MTFISNIEPSTHRAVETAVVGLLGVAKAKAEGRLPAQDAPRTTTVAPRCVDSATLAQKALERKIRPHNPNSIIDKCQFARHTRRMIVMGKGNA
jgi:hypothetical protein